MACRLQPQVGMKPKAAPKVQTLTVKHVHGGVKVSSRVRAGHGNEAGTLKE
jgi:hypothetical protein